MKLEDMDHVYPQPEAQVEGQVVDDEEDEDSDEDETFQDLCHALYLLDMAWKAAAYYSDKELVPKFKTVDRDRLAGMSRRIREFVEQFNNSDGPEDQGSLALSEGEPTEAGEQVEDDGS